MLRANMTDSAKLVAAVNAVLDKAVASQQTRVFVNERDFYESCKFSRLRKTDFGAEVSDYLTTNKFSEKVIGAWLYTEFGDGYGVFIQVAPPEVGISFDALSAAGLAPVHFFK